MCHCIRVYYGIYSVTEIPDDPQVAETYYTQLESFESDSEDEYDALIGCMENALDLSKTGDSSITDEEDSESCGVPASAEQKRKKLKMSETLFKLVPFIYQ